MKKILLAVLVMGISVSSAFAQSTDERAPAGTTRVAIINIGRVLHIYKGSHLLSPELEKSLAPFKEKARRLSEEIRAWHDEMKKPNGHMPPERERQYDEAIRKNKEQLEEMQREIQKLMEKDQEKNLVVIWKEVKDAVQTYAIQNDIQLVLSYGDPMEKDALDGFPNVNRKMLAMDQGSMVPLFMANYVDISEPVVRVLMQQRSEKSKAKSKGDSQ